MRFKLIDSSDRSSHQAFSLIEIVAAIGIVSFALVAIASLFTVLLNNERSAMVHSNLPRMTGTLLHHLKTSQAGGSTPVTEISLYFSDEGRRLQSAANAVYICTATVLGSPILDTERNPGPYTSLVLIEVRNGQTRQLFETAHATLRHE